MEVSPLAFELEPRAMEASLEETEFPPMAMEEEALAFELAPIEIASSLLDTAPSPTEMEPSPEDKVLLVPLGLPIAIELSPEAVVPLPIAIASVSDDVAEEPIATEFVPLA